MPDTLSESERRRLQKLVAQTPGPAPWYWKTFPPITGSSGKQYDWTYHGDQGSLAYLVTLNEPGKPNDPLLALNTYSTPLPMPDGTMALWCPEGRSMIRLLAFDPEKLQPFAFEEIVGWFKNSTDRVFSKTEPIAEFEFSAELPEGTHEIQFPSEFASLQEFGITAGRKAMSDQDPACSVFIVYPHAGLIQVLPQPWFHSGEYEVGKQWITRVTRDPVSHRLIGDGFRIPAFCLDEEGKSVASWL
ncbi:MAG: hypothetical protein ACXVZX_15420 [Terriglobales bacterium]